MGEVRETTVSKAENFELVVVGDLALVPLTKHSLQKVLLPLLF